MGQDHAAGLASDSPHAVVASDDTPGYVVEGSDSQMVLGDPNEFQLIVDQVTNQSDTRADDFSGGELRLAERELAKAMHLVRQFAKGDFGLGGYALQVVNFFAFKGEVDLIVDVGLAEVPANEFPRDLFDKLALLLIPAVMFGLIGSSMISRVASPARLRASSWILSIVAMPPWCRAINRSR